MGKFSLTKRLKVTVFYEQAKVFEGEFERGPIVFGREPACEVVLDYPFASRTHCQLTEQGNNFYLVDLKSRNGVYVNGSLKKRHEFAENFEFRLDKLRIQVALLPLAGGAIHDTPLKKNQASERETKPKADMNRPPTGKPFVAGQFASTQSAVRAKSPVHVGIIDKNFSPELLDFHPGVVGAKFKRLEAIVIWNGQILEVKEFEPNEVITIGPSPIAEISIPVLPKNWSLANVQMEESQCQIIKDLDFHMVREGQIWGSQELIEAKAAEPKGSRYRIKMFSTDVLKIFAGSGIEIVLRYIPATQGVKLKKLNEPDAALKAALIGSAILHGLMSLLLIVTAPKPKNVPQLKNVPERFARLLVEPPKPILPAPTPPPPPEPVKPPPKKEVVKKPELKPQKPVVVKQPKQLDKVNKYPIVVKNPIAKTPPAVVNNPRPEPPQKAPVKVEALGALAALGGGPPKAEPVTQNININKSAGGAPSKVVSMSGVVGALPSTNGKLMAGGSGMVKTKGKGIGSGSEYGTQGLQGSAGSRGVGAGVVGQPKLAQSGKTEGLTRQQVMDVVQKHLAEIQHCYEKSLLSDASLSGRMEFEWDIDASGKVFAVRVKRSTVNGGDNLGECVKSVFAAMSFPRATNGQSTTPSIGFPFGRM